MKTSNTYDRAFWSILHGSGMDQAALQEGSDPASGGYVMPHGEYDDYRTALENENLFRRYGTLLNATKKNGHIQAVASTATAEVVAEGTAFPESEDAFTNMDIGSYKLASLSKLPIDFIMDEGFDLEAYLKREFGWRFGRAEERICILGTGVDEPTGILTAAQTGVSAQSLAYDSVKALFFSLKREYRRNAVWLMNDETGATLRTMKDGAGNYLWRDTDDTILGRPVLFSPYMPDADSGEKPIAFGDLSFYWLIERQLLTVSKLMERFSLSGLIGLTAFERLDGKLIQPEAIQTLSLA